MSQPHQDPMDVGEVSAYNPAMGLKFGIINRISSPAV